MLIRAKMLRKPRELASDTQCGLLIGFGGFLRRSKHSEMDRFVVDADLCSPSSLLVGNTLVSASVMRFDSLIEFLLRRRRNSKIAAAIIESILGDMVASYLFAMYPQYDRVHGN